MAYFTEISAALSWREWSNVSPDLTLDRFGLIRLLAAREATAVANASLRFLYCAQT